MIRIALVAAVIAGCTDAVSIADGTCGNYVLDPGEDCDRPGSACTPACRIVCDPTMRGTVCSDADAIDGTCCPSTMTCGVDNVCHAPAGTLSTSEIVFPFDVESFVVSDINGDLIDDIFGDGPTQVDLRYGDPSTPLATLVVTSAPAIVSEGDIGFGDIDGDGRIDMVLPTNTGLFALSTATGAPVPLTFPGACNSASCATVLTGVKHERIAEAQYTIIPGVTLLGMVALDEVTNNAPGTSNFQLSLLSTPAIDAPDFAVAQTVGGVPLVQPSLCGLVTLTESDVIRGRALHPFIDGVTVRVPIELNSEICVATANPATATAAASYAISKAIAFGTTYKVPSGDGETFLANLISAAGACPDLAFPAVGIADNKDYTLIMHGKGTVNANNCTIDTTIAPVPVDGRPLATITLATTPTQLGLITTEGIYGSVSNAWTQLTSSTRAWAFAAVGDLDGDGRADFATVGTSTDIEVFRQLDATFDLLTGSWIPQFVEIDVPTQDTVLIAALGNFDGDKAGDVAIATYDPTDPTGSADLSIAWGSIDGQFDLEDVGSFTEATSLTATNLLDTSLPPGLDHCDDLVFARGGADPTNAADPTLLVAEYGSTSRVLTAPFVDESKFGGTKLQQGTGEAALVGSFGANGSPGVFGVFALPTGGTSANTTANTSFLDLTYNSFGAFTPSMEGLVESAGSCPTGTTPTTGFCVGDASFIRMTRTGGDLVLAARRHAGGDPNQCMEYFIATPNAVPGLTPIACATLAPGAAAATDPGTMAAYAGLTGFTRQDRIDDDDTTEHIVFSSTTKHAEQTFEWQLTVNAAGQPQLANPISFNTELAAAAVLPPGDVAFCMDGVAAELGARVIGGTTYGADAREIVLPCSVGSGTTYATQIWARYANANGAPYYELMRDLGADLLVRLRAGDINGDGLDDLLYTYGTFGLGEQQIHAVLQCDTHQTGCKVGE